MPDLTPNHPAIEAASMAPYEGREWAADLERMHGGQSFREAGKPGLAAALTAALPHLTADDLPTRLVRDIQVRTIRATARAATYEEDGTPQCHDWDRAAVSAWLNELADNIERDDTA